MGREGQKFDVEKCGLKLLPDYSGFKLLNRNSQLAKTWDDAVDLVNF